MKKAKMSCLCLKEKSASNYLDLRGVAEQHTGTLTKTLFI